MMVRLCNQLPDSDMQISSYTIPPTSDHPFFMTAKRYWLAECEEQDSDLDGGARTLILLHSTSFPKEIWEPFMQAFFRLVSKRCPQNCTGNRTIMAMGNVRDAWAIECPNHGESANLNLRLWASQKPHERVKCAYSISFFVLSCVLISFLNNSFVPEICRSSPSISQHRPW